MEIYEKLQGNADSDQSISDDEDFSCNSIENRVSLGGRTGNEVCNEGGLQIQSRLEILKGSRELNHERETVHSSPVKQTSLSLQDDDVEVSDSANEGDCISSGKRFAGNSTEEIISDDEENNFLLKNAHTPAPKSSCSRFGSGQQGGACTTWSVVTKEAEELIHLNKNVSGFSSCSAYSKSDISFKGSKSKATPRFSFSFQLHKEEFSCPFLAAKGESDESSKVHEVPERLKAIDGGPIEHSITELLQDSHGRREKLSEIVHAEVKAIEHGFHEHSMAELLDGIQDTTSLLRVKSKISRKRGKKLQTAVKGSISSLGGKTIDSEDLPESMGSGSSSDDESDYQNLEVAVPDIKKKTIADKFQEALGATSLSSEEALISAPRQLRTGLSEKLQQVMQIEKERDMHFLKKLQTGYSLHNELNCIDVKITSKYLDAKLTVCHCSFISAIEDIQWVEAPKIEESEGMKGVVIFNPRICYDVDLEIGNIIRIYPPWKEVELLGSIEKIILSTYFFQISM